MHSEQVSGSLITEPVMLHELLMSQQRAEVPYTSSRTKKHVKLTTLAPLPLKNARMVPADGYAFAQGSPPIVICAAAKMQPVHNRVTYSGGAPSAAICRMPWRMVRGTPVSWTWSSIFSRSIGAVMLRLTAPAMPANTG